VHVARGVLHERRDQLRGLLVLHTVHVVDDDDDAPPRLAEGPGERPRRGRGPQGGHLGQRVLQAGIVDPLEGRTHERQVRLPALQRHPHERDLRIGAEILRPLQQQPGLP
jgi:hypothetical protein